MEEPILILLGGLSGIIVFAFWWYKLILFLEKICNEEKEK